jgi:hypothetical protein
MLHSRVTYTAFSTNGPMDAITGHQWAITACFYTRAVRGTHDWTRSPKPLNLFGLTASAVLYTEMCGRQVFTKLIRTKASCSEQSSVALGSARTILSLD